MALLYPVHRSEVVVDAVYSHCLSPAHKHLVLGYARRLEIRQLSPSGCLASVHTLPLLETPLALATLRPLGSELDWLVLAMASGALQVLAFDLETAQFGRKAYYEPGPEAVDDAEVAVATSLAGDSVAVQTGPCTVVVLSVNYSKNPRDPLKTRTHIAQRVMRAPKFGSLVSLAWVDDDTLAVMGVVPGLTYQVRFQDVSTGRQVGEPVDLESQGMQLLPLDDNHALALAENSLDMVGTGGSLTSLARLDHSFDALAQPPTRFAATRLESGELFISQNGRIARVTINLEASTGTFHQLGTCPPADEPLKCVWLEKDFIFAFGSYRPTQVIRLNRNAFEVCWTAPHIGPILDLVPSASPNGFELLVSGGGVESFNVSRLRFGIPVSWGASVDNSEPITGLWPLGTSHIAASTWRQTRVFHQTGRSLQELTAYSFYDFEQQTLAASSDCQVTPSQIRYDNKTKDIASVLAAVYENIVVTSQGSTVTEFDLESGETSIKEYSEQVCVLDVHHGVVAVGTQSYLYIGARKIPLEKRPYSIVLTEHLVIAASCAGTVFAYSIQGNTNLVLEAEISLNPVRLQLLGDDIIAADGEGSAVLIMGVDTKQPKLTSLLNLPHCRHFVRLSGPFLLAAGQFLTVCEFQVAEKVTIKSQGYNTQLSCMCSVDNGILVGSLADKGRVPVLELIDAQSLEVTQSLNLRPDTSIDALTPVPLASSLFNMKFPFCLAAVTQAGREHSDVVLFDLMNFKEIASLETRSHIGVIDRIEVLDRPDSPDTEQHVVVISLLSLRLLKLSCQDKTLAMELVDSPALNLCAGMFPVASDIYKDQVLIGDQAGNLFLALAEMNGQCKLSSLGRWSEAVGITSVFLFDNLAAGPHCLVGNYQSKELKELLIRPGANKSHVQASCQFSERINTIVRPPSLFIDQIRKAQRGHSAAVPQCYISTARGSIYLYCTIDDELRKSLLRLQVYLTAHVLGPPKVAVKNVDTAGDKRIVDWLIVETYFGLDVKERAAACEGADVDPVVLEKIRVSLSTIIK